MDKRKIHKIDLIFIIGIIIMINLGLLCDYIYWHGVIKGGFPVFTIYGIVASYVLWIVLLIYSSYKYDNKENKPKLVRWFMYFLLPFLCIAVIVVETVIFSLIFSIFN